ncbi:hypothetical protein [Streptomyces sp. NPDC012888]|uniref:hypothetical protein n=1 Tax=Streptomyces sp. NPDC012888 TaxID=3364855 RepID=UPI0036820104
MGIFDFLRHDKKKAGEGDAGKTRAQTPQRAPSASPGAAPPKPGTPVTHTPPEAAKRSAPPRHTALPDSQEEAPPLSRHTPPGTAKRATQAVSKHPPNDG